MQLRHALLVLATASCLAWTAEANSFSNLGIFNPFNLFQQASQSVRRMTNLFKPQQGKQASPGGPHGSDEYVDDDEFVEVDMADRVASLVSNSLGQDGANQRQKQQQKQQQNQQQSSGPGLFGGFMRLLGFDSSRLGAIAVNAFIYLSEMIAATLTKTTPNQNSMWRGLARDSKDFEEPEGTPYSWLLDNASPKVTEALKLAQDPELPEMLIGLLKGRSKRSLDTLSNEGPTHCLQRLMCQITPVVRGMQTAVTKAIEQSKLASNHAPGDAAAGGAAEGESTDNGLGSPMAALWRHLPTREQLIKQSDDCEAEYPECQLFDY